MALIQNQERRNQQRYHMNNRMFAVVRSESGKDELERIQEMSKGEIALAILKSKPLRMGEIVEISQEGLSFQHVESDSDIKQLVEMDIVFADEDFHLSGLPIKAVKETAVKGDVPFDVLAMTRLTVKFKELSRKQKGQLAQLLARCTLPVPKRRKVLSKQVWGGRS